MTFRTTALRIYERHTANAGLSKMHGLQHAYAQQRYQELTGWAGGPTVKVLTPEQKRVDQEVHLMISRGWVAREFRSLEFTTENRAK